MRQDKSRVCGFPINGTRRWLMLEYPEEAERDFVGAYVRLGERRHVELYKLLFDHGIDTLLTPIYGPDILGRGEEYDAVLSRGLLWIAQGEEFARFYDEYDVRVHVYGDYVRYLENTPYAPAISAYDNLARRTASHSRYRLFFGACADDPLDTVSQIVVRLYQQLGYPPDKRQIIEAYYGEYIEPLDLFIGFERPAVFDIPLILSGFEDLYFTVSPSPYLDASILRSILYDHLYARRVVEDTYDELAPEDWQMLKEFYTSNRRQVLGLGRMHKTGSFWYPLPHQIQLPPNMPRE